MIRRRFTAGLRNFDKTYKPAVDAWAKYDNVGESPILLEWGENPMKTNAIIEAKDPDLRASGAAMRRAAELARKTAIATGSNLIVVRDGNLTRIPPQALRAKIGNGARTSA